MEYQIGTSVFDDWEIVRRIGSGASGVVYEIQKKGQDIALTSALKVMRVPQDPSVVTSLTDEGMDAQGIESYLQGIVNELIDEIKIMASLKGFPYIVSCEDYKVIRDSQNLQWEVLIRMELLQPLSEYQQENDLTETDVRRLGVHLAKSLALFEKQEIIHRDIKPENIFVNEFGDFKVGDFGIARVYDKTTRLLSKKGTENYMAPEVYRGQEYDNTADIYSLGLILYKLLNKNRLPFYPIDKTFTALEQQKALMSRMSGRQELPMPVLASPEFGRIVLKMCAFRAENLFQNAE
ncbi:MAG: serine/threonine protein kinase [Lachnospiraceae bacterium]|nr:serine/threonine protein kinase [Lachnospiraceae bacterium]